MSEPLTDVPLAGVQTVRTTRVTADGAVALDDRLVVEAPLEIVLHHPSLGADGASFGTTLRTPGADDDLAAGLLYGEAIIERWSDVERIETTTRRANVVNVRLQPHATLAVLPPPRRYSAGSSCGVCGTTSFDAVIERAAASRVSGTGVVGHAVLMDLPARMRAAQSAFAQTGGIHAAGLYALDGTALGLAEDIGRHNALDKLIGESLRKGLLPLADRLVLLSGRASFELVQKAIRAGVSIVAAIGAPSSLAVALAERAGMTLVGFLRDDRCNVYAHPQRVAAAATTG
jgi:FdhD protein